jgi:catechol 2,3-dioxygenase-like lactoylglutathione lyase family enzyme
MFPVKDFRTLALSTTNLQEAERFYTEVLGGKVVDRYEPQPGTPRPREVMIQFGNFKVALADASEGPLPQFPHYTIQAAEWRPREQLEAELQRVGSKVEWVREHRDGKGYSAYVRDRDGNLLELNVTQG